MIEDIVDMVLTVADDAHKAHLYTDNYAQHVALGSFYADVRVAMDNFAESTLAMNTDEVEVNETIVDDIEASYNELLAMRDDVTLEDPALQNSFDELLSVYRSSLYKLKRLS